MKKRKSQNQFGFTLVEMIVSISIIAVISAITLTNYHESNQVAKLNSEVYKLANLIREVQDWSLGVKKTNRGIMPAAWGLKLSRSDNKVTVVPYDFIGGKYVASTTVEATNVFATGVTINRLLTPGNYANTFLVFVPPDPKTIICRQNQNFCNETQLEIVLRDDFSAKTRSIFINKFGLIDID